MSPTIRTAMLPALALATLALLAPAARAIPPDGLTLNDPSQRAALEVLHRARSTAVRTGDPLARRQAVGLLGVRGYVHYARAEARALVADHPDWRPARLLLSDMLARGVDGQLNHAGADRDGAIEVLTALLDEYPDDLGTRKVLASLLGHGIRWRPTTDLAAWARVAELAGDRPAMAWLAGDAALWLGDPEAALAHYARAPEMPWYQTRFAAEAAVHGPDAAIEGMLEVAGPEAVGPLALGTIQTLEMLQRGGLDPPVGVPSHVGQAVGLGQQADEQPVVRRDHELPFHARRPPLARLARPPRYGQHRDAGMLADALGPIHQGHGITQ